MMSLTFGLFNQVSGLGPLGPLVWGNKGPDIANSGAKGRTVTSKFCKSVL